MLASTELMLGFRGPLRKNKLVSSLERTVYIHGYVTAYLAPTRLAFRGMLHGGASFLQQRLTQRRSRQKPLSGGVLRSMSFITPSGEDNT